VVVVADHHDEVIGVERHRARGRGHHVVERLPGDAVQLEGVAALEGVAQPHGVERIVGRRPGEKLREEILSPDESEGARRSGQFYIAPPEPVQLSSLLTQIGQLRIAARANDRERVVHLLQQVVPAYLPDLQHFPETDSTPVSRAA